MTTKEEILKYLESRDNYIENHESCVFEVKVRITNLPNCEDKDLLARTVYDWLDSALAAGIEEHILEHDLENAGIELDEFQFMDWEIDDEVSLSIVENN